MTIPLETSFFDVSFFELDPHSFKGRQRITQATQGIAPCHGGDAATVRQQAANVQEAVPRLREVEDGSET